MFVCLCPQLHAPFNIVSCCTKTEFVYTNTEEQKEHRNGRVKNQVFYLQNFKAYISIPASQQLTTRTRFWNLSFNFKSNGISSSYYFSHPSSSPLLHSSTNSSTHYSSIVQYVTHSFFCFLFLRARSFLHFNKVFFLLTTFFIIYYLLFYIFPSHIYF